jgi:hypothetical protein
MDITLSLAITGWVGSLVLGNFVNNGGRESGQHMLEVPGNVLFQMHENLCMTYFEIVSFGTLKSLPKMTLVSL